MTIVYFSFAIMTIALAIAIFTSVKLLKALSSLSQYADELKHSLNDEIRDTFNLRTKYSTISSYTKGGFGDWEIRTLNNGNTIVVGKFSLDDEVMVIARAYESYGCNKEDREYLYNCAEELFEKLTEEV